MRGEGGGGEGRPYNKNEFLHVLLLKLVQWFWRGFKSYLNQSLDFRQNHQLLMQFDVTVIDYDVIN